MVIPVSSPAFQEGDKIPTKYTCQGQDVSPPLAWSQPPEGTRSLALIMDDPDAPGGVFTHWVLFNIHRASISHHLFLKLIKTRGNISSGESLVAD